MKTLNQRDISHIKGKNIYISFFFGHMWCSFLSGSGAMTGGKLQVLLIVLSSCSRLQGSECFRHHRVCDAHHVVCVFFL